MVPVAVLVIVFSVSNRSAIPVDFWPLPYSITLPLFSMVLGSLLVGFCLGGLVGWVGNWGRRREARRQSRELAAARRELETVVREREEAAAAAGGQDEIDPRVPALPPISPDRG